MVAEAMTEAALGEDTRGDVLVSQVARKREQVRKAHSLIGQVYDPVGLGNAMQCPDLCSPCGAWTWMIVECCRCRSCIDSYVVYLA
jgi:hypothetical protein